MKKRFFFINLDYFICLLLITATLAVFWQVRHHDFINLDDPVYVTQNPHIQSGLSRESVLWAFTSFHSGFWIPLTWVSFMLDFEIYGLNSGGYHLTNLLFHIANTLLLFLILRRTTGGRWQSGFVAALFALHPLHVESVAWVTERKDVLSTFFWMLTIWAYNHFTTHRGLNWYLLGLIAFAMGLMAKPMLVTLPFVLILLDYWPLGRIRLGQFDGDNTRALQSANDLGGARSQAFRLVLEKLPFFALAAACSVVAFFSQQSSGAAPSMDSLPLNIRVANAFISYAFYMVKMIWPLRLSAFYPHLGLNLPGWQAVGAGLLLLLITFFVMRFGRRHPYLPVGWLWYLGTLIPVIGLVQVGMQAMADRFTYIPLIGLFIIIAWGVPDLLIKWRFRNFVLSTAAGIVIAVLMLLTHFQVSLWRNNIILFKQAVAVNANNYLAHINLGGALAEQGNIQEAEKHFSVALKLNPGSAVAHNNLGNILEQQGKLEEAVNHFYTALQSKPNLSQTHFNLGNALLRQGKIEEAKIHFTTALQLKPDFAEAHNSLGVALAQQGRLNEAITNFSKALELKPYYPQARKNLETALRQTGKQEAQSKTVLRP